MYDPTFLRQVSLAVHSDRVPERGRCAPKGYATARTLVTRALSVLRRLDGGVATTPARAEPQTTVSR
jgi:hypothetical protein